ncbi:MAG: D-glycero-beta-D-manno-heptose-7-phosphate kinase [Rhodospirillaceae bacterium]|nr:D-glycero-beta-D-manno-heptose-7-phosphate kinase [Rhodospirillaceae bacterium]
MRSDHAHLAASVSSLKGASLLCVGDIVLDRFVHGGVERISPEAPIPVMLVERETATLGAAGNVARNLVALGALPRFLTAIGDDKPGREITRLVAGQNQIEAALIVEPERQTPIKTRFFAGSQQVMRVDHEQYSPLGADGCAQILDAAAEMMATVGAVVLSDYGKGLFSAELVRGLIDGARRQGLPVVVDPKGKDYRIYEGATIITPNRKELHQATGMPVDSDDGVAAAARHLIATCGIGNVLATRGKDGMSLITGTGEEIHLPAEAREVFDVSGAGDTVTAVLAAALAGGIGIADAARLANAAAAIVVGKIGIAVVEADELIAALHLGAVAEGSTKIAGMGRAQERIADWRRQGLKIGFAHGCFDLLHPGHVSLLSQARACCDRLVVGLNSDESARRLKGEGRPVQSESARAIVLASLAAVDLVVPFAEDTPVALIESLRPDILVRNAEDDPNPTAGSELMQSWGGRVLLAEPVEGQNTTATIVRMRKR